MLSLTVRLALFFEAHPLAWIDGRELARVAGFYAFRTRCSELRRAPYSMTIVNRQRRVPADDHMVTISEYRFQPPDEVRTTEGADGTPMGATAL